MAGEKTSEIRTWLLDEIKRGAFDRNAPLPGDLELAERFKVSRGTVRMAFADLQRQGVIERCRGAGTFLSERGVRKSGVIGFLFPEVDTCGFFGDVRDAFVRFARRYGYSVLTDKISSTEPEAIAGEMRRFARRLAVRPVEGVIFRPLVSNDHAAINREVVSIFEHAQTPVVLFDSDIVGKPERSGCDIVAVNNVDSGRTVAAHLIDGGRKRIAFLMVDCVAGRNINLMDRFFGVAGESVVRGLKDGVRPVTFDPDDGVALQRLYRSHWRPDAIVCGNDEVAVRLVETLKRVGLRIPEQVAVVGFDDIACARASVPPLTTVRQPSAAIAKTLLRTLLTRIRDPESDPREVYLEAPLVLRGTA